MLLGSPKSPALLTLAGLEAFSKMAAYPPGLRRSEGNTRTDEAPECHDSLGRALVAKEIRIESEVVDKAFKAE